MANAWVEFVKQYAKKKNISYGCAISEAGPEYRKLKGMNVKPKEKKKSKITVPKKKTKEEEKPKEVEPPRARRKYFEGLSEPEKEDRKRYKDYKRIKCDKMNSIAFFINQFQLKGNFEEAKDKINTMIINDDVPITPEIYSKSIKSITGIKNLTKQIIDDIVNHTNYWGQCYEFMSDEGLFKELMTLLKNNAPSLYEEKKRHDESNRRRRDGLQPLYDGQETKEKKVSVPKPQPKTNEPNPYDIIISNWDDDYLNVLIDQELPKLGENIERIAERKTLNDDLLLSLIPKEIIEGVLNIGGVEYLSKGLNIIIDSYNGKSFYPKWTLRKGSFPERLRMRILKDLEGVKKEYKGAGYLKRIN